jgi:hypothetical protein
MNEKMDYLVVRFDHKNTRRVLANGLVAGGTDLACTILYKTNIQDDRLHLPPVPLARILNILVKSAFHI